MRNKWSKVGALVMALALVGTLVPVLSSAQSSKSVAETTKVAKIGTTEYATLQEAVDAVTANIQTTITLINNVNTDTSCAMRVGDNKDIILDLNGKTITSATTGYTVDVSKDNTQEPPVASTTTGKLTIKGEGTISNTKTVTESEDAGAVRNMGTLTIKGGKYVSAGNAVKTTGLVTVDGGSFEGEVALYQENTAQASKIVINDGTFDDVASGLLFDKDSEATTNAEVVINGGLFKKDNNYYENVNDSAKVTIGANVVFIESNGYYLAHVHDSKVEVKEVPATCTEAGKTAGTKCSLCGETRSGLEVIPAKGHKTTLVPAKANSRLEKGNIQHYKCENCGKFFKDQAATQELTEKEVFIPALIDIADGVAKVDDSIVDEAISKQEKDDEASIITLSIKDADKSATSVEVSTTSLRKCIAANEEVMVILELPSGMFMAFETNSLNYIATKAGAAQSVKFEVKDIAVTSLTTEQQGALKDKEVVKVVDAAVSYDGNYVTSLGDGLAIVALPFVNNDDTEYDVYYVAKDGKMEGMLADYDTYEEGTYMMFLTNHFSEFAVVKSETSSGGSGGTGSTGSSGSSSVGNGSSGDGTSTTGASKAPATGDESNMTLWVSLLVVAVTGLVSIIIYAKKRHIFK